MLKFDDGYNGVLSLRVLGALRKVDVSLLVYNIIT